ncbi:MAG: CvpA family protein [Bacteroidales bacterium]|jgi:hypothetical protein|nr:CvpA family protein [Bacteroidales bacterium]MDI9575674.1 CvpA family protein [Bacteroidota bacterium]MDD3755156.1 CvpA family protein [Bacteroidales bacterium]MDY0400254.1 CvpA family protein [Bacteroidales bacterium]HHW59085.1 hypothetical protein [Bacteroidales bacterium]
MSTIEVIVVILLVLAAIRGIMTGFLRQLVIFVGYYLLVLLLFGIIGKNAFAMQLIPQNSSIFQTILTMIVLIIGGALLVKFAAKIINAIFNKIPVLGTANRVLGMIFCVILVMFIFGSFISILLNLGVKVESLGLDKRGISHICYKIFTTLVNIF